MDGEPRVLTQPAACGAGPGQGIAAMPRQTAADGRQPRPWLRRPSSARPVGTRFQHLALAAGLAVLLVAIVTVPVVGMLAKAITDPLAHSTSAGAAAALVAFLLWCVLVSIRDRVQPIAASRVRAASLLLPAAVLVGNGANLLAQLDLQSGLGLPWDVAAYHWRDARNTYSYLMHAHAGKAALAAMADLGGLPRAGFDVGDALAARVPAWTAAVCGASLVVSALCAATVAPVIVRRSGSPWVAAVFVLASFNSLKTIVDGGPLTYRFVPMFVALVACLSVLLADRPRVLKCLRATAGGLVVAVAAIWWTTGALLGTEALTGLVSTIAVLGALAPIGVRGDGATQARIARCAVAVRVTCAGVAAAALLQSLAMCIGTLWLPLAAGTMATHCPPAASACTAQDVSGRTALDVYRSFDEDPMKPRYTFVHDADEIGPTRLFAVVVPRATQRATGPAAHDAVSVQPLQPASGRGGVLVEARADGLPRIFGDAPGPHSAHNYYVFLHVVAARLRAQGLAEHAFVPLRSARDARAFGFEAEGTGAR